MNAESSQRAAQSSGFDWILAALDGRTLGSAHERWVAEVQGIHTDGRHWWIQIAPADNVRTSVVLHCSRFARTEQLRATLQRWEPATAPPGLRLSVMC